MSKYLPRETFTKMFSPPSKGSFLFSKSSKTSPFLESCEKFLVKNALTDSKVFMKDFFFFLSISRIISSIFFFSFSIVFTFSLINSHCSFTLSKASSARMFTLPNFEILNCASWSFCFISGTGKFNFPTSPNSFSSTFKDSICAASCAFCTLL